MNFSEALIQLEKGKALTRRGWNGKNMFIYRVPETLISTEQLRDAAFEHVYNRNENSITTISSHIDMYVGKGTIVVGWLASQTDMTAMDWEVVE